MKILQLALLFCCITIGSQSILGQDAMQIMEDAYHIARSQGQDQKILAHMDIQDKSGKTTMERELYVLRKNVSGSKDQKWYAYFKKPADIRKMVFMVWKNENKDDDRWLFLPAMDLVKRLASSDKRSSFAGSQFFYEDITGRYPSEDKHSYEGESDGNHIIKSYAKDKGDVEFDHYISYVDSKTKLINKRIFYNSKGKELRVYKLLKSEKVQGYWTYKQFSMTDMQSGNKTITTYKNVSYDIGIPDEVFTEKSLRKAPRKWLRK